MKGELIVGSFFVAVAVLPEKKQTAANRQAVWKKS